MEAGGEQAGECGLQDSDGSLSSLTALLGDRDLEARQGRGLGLLWKHSQPKPTGTKTLPQGVSSTLVSPPSGTACLCQRI